MPKLNNKQERFVLEYLVDLNATQAAIRAGYSRKTADQIGWENLQKPHIAQAVSEALKQREQRTNITQDYVLASIFETVERCRQAVPVLDRKGNPVMVETADGEMAPAFAFQPANVLKGAELLGKHLGMFAQRKELTGKDGGPIEVNEITAAQRLETLLGVMATND